MKTILALFGLNAATITELEAKHSWILTAMNDLKELVNKAQAERHAVVATITAELASLENLKSKL